MIFRRFDIHRLTFPGYAHLGLNFAKRIEGRYQCGKKTDGRNWVDCIIRNNLCPPVSFALRFIVWRIIKLLDHQYRGEGVIYKLVFIQSNSYHNVSYSIVVEHFSSNRKATKDINIMMSYTITAIGLTC